MTIDKNLIKVINEEISKYDFLGGDKLKEQQEYYNLIENEDFQKQFITDFILGKTDKYKIIDTVESRITGDYSDDFTADQINYISIEYAVKIEYKYDLNKEPVQFELFFSNDERIPINVDGEEDKISTDRGIQNITDSWITFIDWNKINVDMFSIDGDTIEFKAFKRATPEIRNIFVREFTKEMISTETNMEIRED
jgi:hypothetical protein